LAVEGAGTGESGLGKGIVQAGEVAELHGDRTGSAAKLAGEGDDLGGGTGELAEVEARVELEYLAKFVEGPADAVARVVGWHRGIVAREGRRRDVREWWSPRFPRLRAFKAERFARDDALEYSRERR